MLSINIKSVKNVRHDRRPTVLVLSSK